MATPEDAIKRLTSRPNWRTSDKLHRYLMLEADVECECGEHFRGFNAHGYHSLREGLPSLREGSDSGHKIVKVDGRKYSIDSELREHIEGVY